MPETEIQVKPEFGLVTVEYEPRDSRHHAHAGNGD